MLSDLFHKIITVLHSRGLINIDEKAELHRLVAQAVTVADDTEAAATVAASAGVPEAGVVEAAAGDVARAGQSVEEHLSDEPAGA